MAARRLYRLADVRRTLRRNEQRLLALPNVLYLGIGEKVSAGEGRRHLCIRVYVSKKRRLRGHGRIPRRLRVVDAKGRPTRYFVPTDVTERPAKLTALAVRGGSSVRGDSLGSLGVPYFSVTGQALLLTNSHVVAPLGSRAIGAPIFGPGQQRLGTVLRTTPLFPDPDTEHFLDASVIEAEVAIDSRRFIAEARRLVVVAPIIAGDQATYFYRTATGARKEFVRPQLVSTPRLVTVHGRQIRFNDFFELKQITGPPLVAGDSGSALLRERFDGLVGSGLVFAGGGATLAVVRLTDVLAALQEPWTSDDGSTAEIGIDFSQ